MLMKARLQVLFHADYVKHMLLFEGFEAGAANERDWTKVWAIYTNTATSHNAVARHNAVAHMQLVVHHRRRRLGFRSARCNWYGSVLVSHAFLLESPVGERSLASGVVTTLVLGYSTLIVVKRYSISAE